MPIKHALQVVVPLAFWYSPRGHGVHELWPSMAVIEPGAHGTGAVEPVAHLEPAGHVVQSLEAALPVAFE